VLAVAFDAMTSHAAHLVASGIWIILTSLLSSPAIFLFCWSVRGAGGQHCILLRSGLAAMYETEVYFLLPSTLTVTLILKRKKYQHVQGIQHLQFSLQNVY